MERRNTENKPTSKDVSNSKDTHAGEGSSKDAFRKSLIGLQLETSSETRKTPSRAASFDESMRSNVHLSIVEALRLKRQLSEGNLERKAGKSEEKYDKTGESSLSPNELSWILGLPHGAIDASMKKGSKSRSEALQSEPSSLQWRAKFKRPRESD